MSRIYWPKMIFYGCVGYMGVLYVSSVIDKRNEKPKVNVINLGPMLPSLEEPITRDNVLEQR